MRYLKFSSSKDQNKISVSLSVNVPLSEAQWAVYGCGQRQELNLPGSWME